MTEPESWRSMRSAPKDGCRILVTVRAAEQGEAEVDVAYWSRGDAGGADGWRAADSHPGCVIAYAETELKCWMPLPGAAPGRAGAEVAPRMPALFQGKEIEVDGSGI